MASSSTVTKRVLRLRLKTLFVKVDKDEARLGEDSAQWWMVTLPPSTMISVPVMNEALGLNRNATA
jgi:hypothetical protein